MKSTRSCPHKHTSVRRRSVSRRRSSAEWHWEVRTRRGRKTTRFPSVFNELWHFPGDASFIRLPLPLAISTCFTCIFFSAHLYFLGFFFLRFLFVMIFYHFAPARRDPSGAQKTIMGRAQYMRQNEWKDILHLTCFSTLCMCVCVLGLLHGFLFFICLLNSLLCAVTLMKFILNAYRHVAFIHST